MWIVLSFIKIIPNEQTPKLEPVANPEAWGKENKELFDKLIEFLESSGRNPIGLAANQVSIDGERCMHRFFIERDLKDRSQWSLMVNPKIIENIGITVNVIEGCLTWDSGNVRAKRYNRIKVSYYTLDGEYKEEEIVGFRAHVWQHEINHIDGVPEDIVDIEVNVTNPKIQRNDKCPCNSGKKYKNCCGPYMSM